MSKLSMSKLKHTKSSLPAKHSGFTLIELVVVIIILGILAVVVAPKFLSIQQDAQISTVKGTAGGFKSAITLARSVWAVKVGKGPAEDIPVFGTSSAGFIDFNATGWPAQHYLTGNEASPSLNNVADCLSVWQVLFQSDEPTVSSLTTDTDGTDYRAQYINPNQCRYFLRANETLSIYYDSRNGEVSIDVDPN